MQEKNHRRTKILLFNSLISRDQLARSRSRPNLIQDLNIISSLEVSVMIKDTLLDTERNSTDGPFVLL